MIDLADVTFVKRVRFGSIDPHAPQPAEEADAHHTLLNRMLVERPPGHILGIEKEVAVVQVGQEGVALQAITYHVGFSRRPAWLPE